MRSKDPNTKTYDGKPCVKCGLLVRYQSSRTCATCDPRKEYYKNYRQENAKRYSDNYRIWKYGVTPEQVTELKRKQDYKCAICRKELPEKFVVDHSHVSGKVRGLLCRNCNLMIGWAKDSSDICESASQYLKDTTVESRYILNTTVGLNVD